MEQEAIRGLLGLLQNGDLVRDTSGDANVMNFLRQGVRIAAALKAAQDALDGNADDPLISRTDAIILLQKVESEERGSVNANGVRMARHAIAAMKPYQNVPIAVIQNAELEAPKFK